MTRCLVVVTHPNADSLTRAAYERVILGLTAAGHELRMIDLDAQAFDPRLTAFERTRHLGLASERPDLAEHIEALRWAERLVLVYPTWFSGQPARLKGWFDRVWMNDVVFHLPEGATRTKAKLHNVRRIDVVTSHGSSRLVNFIQGNGGRLTVMRTMRIMCHPLCRTSWTAIYQVDQQPPEAFVDWLTKVEQRFSR